MSDMSTQEKPSIGENVSRIVRILLGRDDLKQTDLAVIMGYDGSTITRSLKGQREWRVNDLVALGEAFEVSPGLFFEDPQRVLIRTSKATTESSDDNQNYLITDRTLVDA